MGEILYLVEINTIIFYASWSSIFCFDLSMTALHCPNAPNAPPLSSSWPLLEEPPHTSLYSLYQLADLTRQHCCPPILESKLQWDEQACLNLTNPIAACPVFSGWSTGVPTNFLNSKKPKIINNFELKTGQMHSRSPFADLTCCETSKPWGTLRFSDLSFFFSRWSWNQQSNIKFLY